MHTIYNLVLATFETILLIALLDNILIQNSNRTMIRRILFVIYFFFQCITYFIDFPFFSTSFYYIIFTVFISLVCYIDDTRIKLITSSMFVTLNYASKLLSATIVAILSHKQLPETPFDYVLSPQMQALACTIVLVMIVLIILMRRLNNRTMSYFINGIIFILPMANLYTTMRIFEQTGNSYFNITSLLFSYSFLLLLILDQIVYSTRATQISRAMQDRLQMQTIYYQDIQKYSNEMSRFRHDVKNHLQNIQALLMGNKIEDATDYLNHYTHQMLSIKPIVNTGNAVVDVILNSKMNLAQQLKIEVHNDIVIPPVLNISSVDLSIILANLSDNAIEACKKLNSDKYINLKMQVYKNSLFISFENTFNGDILKNENRFISTKFDTNEHGLGVENVRHIVKKNKGTIEINHANKIFTVTILIPNCNPEQVVVN